MSVSPLSGPGDRDSFPSSDEPPETDDKLAAAIRNARHRAGLSVRGLARKLDVSASFVSQLEHAKAKPSVETLFAIARETGLSLDQLFAEPSVESFGRDECPDLMLKSVKQIVDSYSIELEHGVRWQRLPTSDPGLHLLYTEYLPGADSAYPGHLQHHAGYDHGIVLEGTLVLTYCERTYRLDAGDMVSYPGHVGHRLSNDTDKPARAVWMVGEISRTSSDTE